MREIDGMDGTDGYKEGLVLGARMGDRYLPACRASQRLARTAPECLRQSGLGTGCESMTCLHRSCALGQG